jgi:hypothetical protein
MYTGGSSGLVYHISYLQRHLISPTPRRRRHPPLCLDHRPLPELARAAVLRSGASRTSPAHPVHGQRHDSAGAGRERRPGPMTGPGHR